MGSLRLNLSTVRLHSLFAIPLRLTALSAFIKALEMHGWDADTQLEHPSLTMGPPLEETNATPEEREEIISDELRQSTESKRALIVKVSHVGGHKYAGNVIVSVFAVWLSYLLPPDTPLLTSYFIRYTLHLAPVYGMGVSLHTTSTQ